MLVLLLVSVLFPTVFACPTQCVCYAKQKLINCAKAGLSSVPKDLPRGYKRLNLAYNQIQLLTRNDMKHIRNLTIVDLRGNPLNCSLFTNVKNTLSDCPKQTTTTQTTTTSISRSPDAWNTTTTFFSRSTQSGIALKSNSKPIWFYGLVGVGVLVTLGVIMFVFCFLRRRRERVIAAVALPLQTFGEGSSDEEEILMFKSKQL